MDAYTSTFLALLLIPLAAASWLLLWFHKGALLPGLTLHVLSKLRLIKPLEDVPGGFLLADEGEIRAWSILKTPAWVNLLMGCPYCMSVHLCFWMGLMLGVVLGSPVWYALPFIGAAAGPYPTLYLHKNGPSK